MGWVPSTLKRVFSVAALAGTMVSAQACATSRVVPDSPGPVPETPAQAPFHLFMSEKTEQSLGSLADGLKRALPQWAQADVLLLLPGDTEGLSAFPQNPVDHTAEEMMAGAASMKSLVARFPEFPDAESYANDTNLDRLAHTYWSLQAGVASMVNLWNGARPAAVIMMPDFKPESLPSLHSLLDSIFSNQPKVSFAEFFVNVLRHEAGHARLGHGNNTNDNRPGQDLISLEGETAADRFLFSGYDELAALGLPHNKELPELVENMRALSALRIMGTVTKYGWSEFATHASHVRLNVESGRNGTQVTEDSRFDTPRIAAGMVRVNDLAIGVLASIVRSQIDPSSGQYPFGINPVIFMGVMSDYQTGTVIAGNEMLLQYGAVKLLQDRGYFHPDSVEAVIAGEYLRAFEEYAPAVKTDPHLLAFMEIGRNMPDLFAYTSLKPEEINQSADIDYQSMKTALDALRTIPPVLMVEQPRVSQPPQPRIF